MSGPAQGAAAEPAGRFGRRHWHDPVRDRLFFLRRCLWPIARLIVFAVAWPSGAAANGHDLPAEIILQAYVKPEHDRLHLVVRVPLVLLTSFDLPKRGPGYLDLAAIDQKLQLAAEATGRQLGLQEDGVDLVPNAVSGRISIPSDRSFANYESALSHLKEPPVPVNTDLFWNQGYFDAHLEYPIRSADGHFSIDVNVAPELEQRLKLRLQYLPPEAPVLNYMLPGDSGRIALDPSWYEAALLFLKVGFVDAFALDRFAFLLCLIAPFRRFRSLLAVVLVLTAMQVLTLTAIAEGAIANSPLWPEFLGTSLAAATVLLAIGNLAAPSLRRRWLVCAVVGAVYGLGLGHLLDDAMQSAGARSRVAVGSFNAGLALGAVAGLALALASLRLLFDRLLGGALGLVILSAVVGHMAWHWMLDQGHEFLHQLVHFGLGTAAATVGPWPLAAVVVGALGRLLPMEFGGPPIRSLLAALLDRPATGSTTRHHGGRG